MKQIKYLLVALIILQLTTKGYSQNVNWRTLGSQKHIINLHAGWDNGSVAGISYGYKLNTGMPLVLNLDYEVPLGEQLVDDMKIRLGGRLNVIHSNSFQASVNAYGIIRRFENEMTRMVNFGSEFSGTAGIYKNNWFVAGEFGFDKAIVTEIKHSALAKEYNPGLESGWYIPTGGNFLYGVTGGLSFNKKNDLYIKLGKTKNQDLKTGATVPYYLKVGWNFKW